MVLRGLLQLTGSRVAYIVALCDPFMTLVAYINSDLALRMFRAKSAASESTPQTSGSTDCHPDAFRNPYETSLCIVAGHPEIPVRKAAQ